MSIDQVEATTRSRIIAEIEDIVLLEHQVEPTPNPRTADRWHLIYWMREARSQRLGLDTDRHPDLLSRFLVGTGWGRAVGLNADDVPALEAILLNARAEGLTTFDETRRARIADLILGSDWFRGIEERNA